MMPDTNFPGKKKQPIVHSSQNVSLQSLFIFNLSWGDLGQHCIIVWKLRVSQSSH